MWWRTPKHEQVQKGVSLEPNVGSHSELNFRYRDTVASSKIALATVPLPAPMINVDNIDQPSVDECKGSTAGDNDFSSDSDDNNVTLQTEM